MAKNEKRHRMEDAPKDGTQIIAYVQNTEREILVHWNGRFWDEGNGEKWDTWQLVRWRPVVGRRSVKEKMRVR